MEPSSVLLQDKFCHLPQDVKPAGCVRLAKSWKKLKKARWFFKIHGERYQLWCGAPEAGVKYSTYIGDDDSTTLADINSKVPCHVEKHSDIIRSKRSLKTRLFNLNDLILKLQTVMF